MVGEPTAGWIIYTGSVTLIDGSVLRMPATKIFASRRHADGDAPAAGRRAGDAADRRELHAARTSQLDTAVAELLKQLRRPREEHGGDN